MPTSQTRLVSRLKRRRCHPQVAYRPKVVSAQATAAPQNKHPSDTSDDRFVAVTDPQPASRRREDRGQEKQPHLQIRSHNEGYRAQDDEGYAPPQNCSAKVAASCSGMC